MYRFSRGFTLVEIMIVIAIIGTLSAALYPSITGYMIRGRDASRVSEMSTISTAVQGYFSDYSAYPSFSSYGCVDKTATGFTDTGSLNTYFPSGIPRDTHNRSIEKKSICYTNSDGGIFKYDFYGYGRTAGSTGFVLSVNMENQYGGNYGSSPSNSWYQAYPIPGSWYIITGNNARYDYVKQYLYQGTGSFYLILN